MRVSALATPRKRKKDPNSTSGNPPQWVYPMFACATLLFFGVIRAKVCGLLRNVIRMLRAKEDEEKPQRLGEKPPKNQAKKATQYHPQYLPNSISKTYMHCVCFLWSLPAFLLHFQLCFAFGPLCFYFQHLHNIISFFFFCCFYLPF